MCWVVCDWLVIVVEVLGFGECVVYWQDCVDVMCVVIEVVVWCGDMVCMFVIFVGDDFDVSVIQLFDLWFLLLGDLCFVLMLVVIEVGL